VLHAAPPVGRHSRGRLPAEACAASVLTRAPHTPRTAGVPALVEAVSRVHTLEEGDLLLTGTPEGVGPVGPGDVITAGIDSLGLSLTVPVVAAPS